MFTIKVIILKLINLKQKKLEELGRVILVL